VSFEKSRSGVPHPAAIRVDMMRTIIAPEWRMKRSYLSHVAAVVEWFTENRQGHGLETGKWHWFDLLTRRAAGRTWAEGV
jgi:hypothetical protein